MPDDIQRKTTGVEKLDEVLDGGFPHNSSVIVVGPPGVGKSTFINQFMYDGLSEGEKGVYLTLDNSPDEVRENAAYFGWEFTQYEEDFVFIDGYSWREGEDISGRFAIKGPSDLNQMNMTLADAMSEVGDGSKRMVLDSVSTLVLYTDPNSAVKFLQVVGAKSKASDGCLLMTLEEGVHDEQTISTLNYVADGMIRMKMDGDTRKISVQRMEKTSHSSDWMEYKITEDGGLEIID
jgi:KaiC/GvpD/RAD55 family RecA-like ATPase